MRFPGREPILEDPGREVERGEMRQRGATKGQHAVYSAVTWPLHLDTDLDISFIGHAGEPNWEHL